MKKIIIKIIIVIIILCSLVAPIDVLFQKEGRISHDAWKRAEQQINVLREEDKKRQDEIWKKSSLYVPGKENPYYVPSRDTRPEVPFSKAREIEAAEKAKVQGEIDHIYMIIDVLRFLGIALFVYLLYLFANLLCLGLEKKKWIQPIRNTLHPFSVIITCALTLVLYHIRAITNVSFTNYFFSGITYDPFYYDSKMAMIMFCFSHATKTPIAICTFIIIILGVIFVNAWYIPAMQYVVLEILAYLLGKFVAIFLGPTVSDGGLYEKIKRYFCRNKSNLETDKIITEKDEDAADGKSKIDENDYQPAITLDDLPKLKKMLDEGIITQEEFDRAKKDVLG